MIVGPLRMALVWALAWWSAPLRQPPSSTPVSPSAASLDQWIVTHYRGAGLLPDTASSSPSLVTSRTSPRIESVADGRVSDSLWAVHFSGADHVPAFAVNATVRLTGPTGTVTPLTARVVARRPFRAPRVPGASPARPDAWREGWAYLVVVPHRDARQVARYRGWLLLAAPRTTRPARPSSHSGS